MRSFSVILVDVCLGSYNLPVGVCMSYTRQVSEPWTVEAVMGMQKGGKGGIEWCSEGREKETYKERSEETACSLAAYVWVRVHLAAGC